MHLAKKSPLLRDEKWGLRVLGLAGSTTTASPQSPCPHLEEKETKPYVGESEVHKNEEEVPPLFTWPPLLRPKLPAGRGQNRESWQSQGRLDLGRRRSERGCWARDRDRYTKSRPEVGPASSCLAHSRKHMRRHPAPANPEGPQFAHLQPGHQ